MFYYNVDSCRIAMEEEATKYVRPGRPWQERWLVAPARLVTARMSCLEELPGRCTRQPRGPRILLNFWSIFKINDGYNEQHFSRIESKLSAQITKFIK